VRRSYPELEDIEQRKQMSTTKVTPDLVDKLVDRFSKASERFVKDIEKQIHQIDKRIKAFVDQGEAATTRLVETVDKELRAQITSLRKEVEHLSSELASLRPGAPRPAAKPAVKKTTTARTPAKRTPAKAAPAKRTPRKTPAKRAAA